MPVTLTTPLGVLSPVTSAGSLVAGKHNPVDATAGPLTMPLPVGTTSGEHLSVEKVDSSANAVTVSGSLRGSASTISLTLTHETVELITDSSGSWWPVAGHKTMSSISGALSSTYALAVF